MNYLKELLILSIAIVIFSCNVAHDQEQYKITINAKNASQKKVYLEELAPNNLTVIDTGNIADNGICTLQGYVSEKGIFRLKFETEQVIFLILDNQEINVDIDLEDPKDYSISNSEESLELKTLIDKAGEANKKLQGIQQAYKKAIIITNNRDSLMKETQQSYMQETEKFNTFLKSFISESSSPFVKIFAAGMLDPNRDGEMLQKTANYLKKNIPDSKYTKDFLAKIGGPKGTQQGNPAKEIDLPMPNGNSLALSSLKGKVVLLDFWASWCKPCRMENPNVVKTYEKYKDRGFTIYSVSLDQRKDQWISAIKADGLTWSNHVSDLKGWNSSAAATYNVNGIPATFLIDESGTIVAKNLRGEQLNAFLEEYFNKKSS